MNVSKLKRKMARMSMDKVKAMAKGAAHEVSAEGGATLSAALQTLEGAMTPAKFSGFCESL